MDIKVLQNFDISSAMLIKKNLVLAVCEDESARLGTFTGKRLSLINPETSERVEVAPDISKFFVEDVIYATTENDYVVFPTAEAQDEDIIITWYIYKVTDASVKQLHTMKVPVSEYKKSFFLKVFVLDELHLLIQTEKCEEERSVYSYVMYNSSTGVVSDVTIPRLVEAGIDSVIPISENTCAIKFGKAFRPDKPYAYKLPEHPPEFIGMVPVNKLISELSINMDNKFVEVIEESNEMSTLPYMRVSGNLIIYAIYYPSEEKEDIILYDTETGNKKIRINSRLQNLSDLWHTFVIDGQPYLVSGTGAGAARITDLNTQKVVHRLERGDDIPAFCGDYVVMTRKKKKLFKESDYVEIFEFSKLLEEPVLSVKASLEYCLTGDDVIIVFVNDSKGEDE